MLAAVWVAPSSPSPYRISSLACCSQSPRRGSPRRTGGPCRRWIIQGCLASSLAVNTLPVPLARTFKRAITEGRLAAGDVRKCAPTRQVEQRERRDGRTAVGRTNGQAASRCSDRSEEHTSELQSRV